MSPSPNGDFSIRRKERAVSADRQGRPSEPDRLPPSLAQLLRWRLRKATSRRNPFRLTEEDIHRIADSLYAAALSGDVRAAKLLLRFTIGPPAKRRAS